MKQKLILYFLFFVCVPSILVAQNEDIQNLDAVYLTADTPIRDFSKSQNIIKITDSIIKRNPADLTSLLNFNSTIYFKQNGLGMVSSASFRGTTASQTAVLWNGININSLSTGQTDFNTINTRGFDNIEVKSGGGSVGYGSGAIGGSVHLNNSIKFNNKVEHSLFANYGSYDTYGVNLESRIATDKISLSISLARNASENDYEYPNSDLYNINGQYYNNNLGATFAYQLSEKTILKYYGNVYDGERHFSVVSPNAIKTKYHDFNIRNLAELQGFYGKFTSSLKLAYLQENYRYYPYINSDEHTFGTFDSKLIKYNLGYDLNPDIKIQAFLDYTQNQGNGSDIVTDTRQIGAASVMFKHEIKSKFLYEITLKQELTDIYTSPFLYSFGFKWDITEHYHIKSNVSRNFKIPTFNDMYWQGSGNPDLEPELSSQAELSNVFTSKHINVTLTAYYNDITNMIRWIPVSGDYWAPENVDQATIYGLESLININKTFHNHNLKFTGTYAYTVSENSETNKQLTYVPYHKATAALSYANKRFSSYYQFLWNGEVFTTTDNNPYYSLDSYMVSNLGLEYQLDKSNNYAIGFQVLNLWNEDYQSVLNRPLPGRNFNVYINLKLN